MQIAKNTPSYIKYNTFLDCQMRLELIKYDSEHGIK